MEVRGGRVEWMLSCIGVMDRMYVRVKALTVRASTTPFQPSRSERCPRQMNRRLQGNIAQLAQLASPRICCIMVDGGGGGGNGWMDGWLCRVSLNAHAPRVMVDELAMQSCNPIF